MTAVGCIDRVRSKYLPAKADTKVCMDEDLQLSLMIGKDLRNASGYRKPNSGIGPATKDKAVEAVGLANSMIRTNRIGGAFGHAEFMDMKMLRDDIVNPYGEHPIPRNRKKATIIVPGTETAARYDGEPVTKAVPFYHGVMDNEKRCP